MRMAIWLLKIRPIFPGEAGLWLLMSLVFLANSLHPFVLTTSQLKPLQDVWPIFVFVLNVLLALLLGRSLTLQIQQSRLISEKPLVKRSPVLAWIIGLVGVGIGIALGFRLQGHPVYALTLGLSLGAVLYLMALTIWRKIPLRFLGFILFAGLSTWLLDAVLPSWNVSSRFLLGAAVFSLATGMVLGYNSWKNNLSGQTKIGSPRR